MQSVQGVIDLELDPSVEVSFRLEGSGFVDTGDTVLRLRRHGVGPVALPAFITNSNGSGHLMGGDLGGSDSLDRVIVHWLNLPPIHLAEPLAEGGSFWSGRVTLATAGWTLTLDARRDLEVTCQSLRGTRRSAITHIGLLRRANGSAFSTVEAKDVLYGFQMAFSAALGRWVAPALPVGFDANGSRVWEQWAPWRCDPTDGNLSWFDTHRSVDLQAFVSAFIDNWCDAARVDVVRYFTHHLLAANQPSVTVEGRIMLVQAAFEYLGWVENVLSGRVPKKVYSNSSSWPAARKLTMLLSDHGISAELPSGYPALATLARSKNFATGAETLVKVRNMLVHPTDANEPYRIDHLVTEAWHLSLQWGNLLLLARLGYQGSYQPWSMDGGWKHTSIPVPWAAPAPAAGAASE